MKLSFYRYAANNIQMISDPLLTFLDDDSTGDSWELRQRHRQELVEPLREEVRQAMAQLQDEFKQGNAFTGEEECCMSVTGLEDLPI